LRTDTKKLDASATSLQLAKMQERGNALRRKINAWVAIQHLYMPEVATLRARDTQHASEDSPEVAVCDTPLYLPSALAASTPCNPKLQQVEFKLREAQAYESLDDLRQRLRLQSHMWKYKDRHVAGQRASTRQYNLIQRVDKKVGVSAQQYRRARKALSKLADRVNLTMWRSRLLPLNDEDVRKMNEGQPGESEGKRKLSWIWLVQGLSEHSDDVALQEGGLLITLPIEQKNYYYPIIILALRIEWCRTRARAMRFSEEVLLLREEMRRALESLKWYEDWWGNQGPRRTDVPVDIGEGLVAYAQKQASYRRALHDKFNQLWRQSAELCALGIGADNEILDLDMTVNYMLASPSEVDEVPPVTPEFPGQPVGISLAIPATDDMPLPRFVHQVVSTEGTM
jgi:hypothetical protein